MFCGTTLESLLKSVLKIKRSAVPCVSFLFPALFAGVNSVGFLFPDACMSVRHVLCATAVFCMQCSTRVIVIVHFL